MPKATKSSACGNNHLSQTEEMIPNNQEELSISEQEPDPEVSFNNLGHPNQSQACHAIHWRSQNGLDIGFKVALEMWEYSGV